jgi:hypothetical protein
MKIFKRIRGTERTVAIALAAAFLGLIVGTAAASTEENESGICEQAFGMCLADAWAKGGGASYVSMFYYLQFCAVGYSFCERFVEAFLDRR